MIERLILERFRGIQSGLMDMAPFTVLVGPNNCGKTAILEALYLAATASTRAQLTVVREGSPAEQYEALLPGPDLSGYPSIRRVLQYHNLDRPSLTEERWDQGVLKVNLGRHDGLLEEFDVWPLSPIPDAGRTVTGMFAIDIGEASRQRNVNLQSLFASLVKAPDGESLHTDRRLALSWVPDLAYRYQTPAIWVAEGNLPNGSLTTYCNAVSLAEKWGWPFYRSMLTRVPGWSSDVPKAFAQIFSIDDTLQFQLIQPEGSDCPQVVVTPEGGVGLSLDTFGDGARAAFKLLSSLEALKASAKPDSPGLLLWEEPELFQHPRTLGKLLEYTAQSIQGRSIQVVLSTHSLEVIGHLTELLVAEQIAPMDFLLLRLELRQGKLRISPFRKENLVAWLEDGLDPRMWGDLHAPVHYLLRDEKQV